MSHRHDHMQLPDPHTISVTHAMLYEKLGRLGHRLEIADGVIDRLRADFETLAATNRDLNESLDIFDLMALDGATATLVGEDG